MGLTVRPPHVNYSNHNFVVACPESGRKVLFMGLDQVRNMTRRTIGRIQRSRPFVSLEDFLTRVDPPPQEAEYLARIGAFESWGTIPALLRRLHSGGWQAGQPGLFDYFDHGADPNNLSGIDSAEDWTLEQKVAAQNELLGISLDAHPLELVANKISSAGAISTVEAAGRVGQRVTVAGIRQSGHRSRTARGDLMMFLTLEDLTGMLDVVVFPAIFRQARELVQSSEPFLVTGVIKIDPGHSEPLLMAEKVSPLTRNKANRAGE